jgi:hypothetical protein
MIPTFTQFQTLLTMRTPIIRTNVPYMQLQCFVVDAKNVKRQQVNIHAIIQSSFLTKLIYYCNKKDNRFARNI